MEEVAELLPPWEPSLLCGATVSAVTTLICTEWGLPALPPLILEPDLACELIRDKARNETQHGSS